MSASGVTPRRPLRGTLMSLTAMGTTGRADAARTPRCRATCRLPMPTRPQVPVGSPDIAFLVAHHPGVWVGDIRPRLGPGAVGSGRLVDGPAPASDTGRRSLVPGFLLWPAAHHGGPDPRWRADRGP